MSAIETYPLNVKQFIVDTLRLTPMHKAAYLMILLDYCARGEAPPDDDNVLCSVTGLMDWSLARPLIATLFDIRDGRWYHTAIEAEIERQAKVKTTAMTASDAAKRKRDERKGIAAFVSGKSDNQLAGLVNVEAVKQEVERLGPAPQLVTIEVAQPAAPVDHPIPEDFAIDGADFITCQSAGANLEEIAEWSDYFRQYHAEAGTLATDWKALFYRFVARKVEERDKKPKVKPRIELSRRAPAPPGAA